MLKGDEQDNREKTLMYKAAYASELYINKTRKNNMTKTGKTLMSSTT